MTKKIRKLKYNKRGGSLKKRTKNYYRKKSNYRKRTKVISRKRTRVPSRKRFRNNSRKRRLRGGASNHPSVSDSLSKYASNYSDHSHTYGCVSPSLTINDSYYMFTRDGIDSFGSVSGVCNH